MSLEYLEWWINIHGIEEHEARDWSLLWTELVHGLQVPTIDNFLSTMFRVGLQSYFKITTAGMKQSTLQQHKEVTMLCEEGMIIAKARNAL